jgi:hypothetical protein
VRPVVVLPSLEASLETISHLISTINALLASAAEK